MTTPIPQIPFEAFPFLTALGVKACVSGLGDTQAIKDANDELTEGKMLLNSIGTPRVEGSPKTLSNPQGVLNYSRGGLS
jgi:hypothetical protein